jgi:Ca2+-binding EF-hand superfamily protein
MADAAEEQYTDWRKSPPEVKRMFDKDAKDGFYSKASFAELLEAMDPAITEEQVDQDFDIANTTKADGQLGYDDFYNYFVNWETLKNESADAVDVKGAMSSSAVYVRVRPLADAGGHAAGEAGDYAFKDFDEATNTIAMTNRGRETKFNFAKKVLSECTQKEMYDTMVPDMVNSMLMRQMDVMFLAYGQTGTGKTHTMFGPPDSLDPESCPTDGPHPEWGIFPRTVEYVLSTISSATATEMGSTLNTKVTVSAMEFYMMGAFDLLNSQAPLFIEDGRPQGLSEREVKSHKDACVFLKEVYGNRHVRKTAMNEGSSRSHTALVLKAYFCDSKDGDFTQGSFTLFDLAGAERTSKTGGDFISPMDAMNLAAKGKDPGTGGEGAIINWDLTSMMNQVQNASDCAKAKRAYKCGTALITPAIQTIASCFDGRALMGMVVCLSQAPQHGSESWFSCTMGEKLASLKSRVKPRPIGKIEKVIKDREDKLKKCQKSLKDKPKHKFVPQWTAQITGLNLELQYLNELKVYDASKDQISSFVRKKLGLFAATEGASEDEKIAEVRATFAKADSNGDKLLSMAEFKAIFAALPNSNMAPDHVESLFKQIDTDNDKSVSFDEFFTYLFPKAP